MAGGFNCKQWRVGVAFLVRIILEVVQSEGMIHQIMSDGKGNGILWFSNSIILCYIRVLNSRNGFVLCDWVITKLEIVA